MKKILRLRVAASVVFLMCLATAIAASAQTFTTLASFDNIEGYPVSPIGSPVQGLDGNFYGTTLYGGIAGCGVGCGSVFKITPGGTLATLYTFCVEVGCPDGSNPFAGLILAPDGNFYGTTQYGGISGSSCNVTGGCGTVFRITPAGELTTLHNFDGTDGALPQGTLVWASDGNFYGTTASGGTADSGTIYKIAPDGSFTSLYTFCLGFPKCTDGSDPSGGLIQGRDGNFYGTTAAGGTNGYCGNIQCGTIFKITPNGTLSTIYDFCAQTNCTDGSEPFAAMIQGRDGTLYGTTYNGGTTNQGTVFNITLDGTFVTVYSFCPQFPSCPTGKSPGTLLQASDGNFYGEAGSGGAYLYWGTVFRMTPDGTVRTLHSFCADANCADGGNPAGLVEGTDGSLYGTTIQGGTSTNCHYGCGTVYGLSVGLRPSIETLPTFGRVGSAVIILGNGLTGTTSVTFNGTVATFAVASDSEVKTTVPTGATSGKVQVTTPHGTLTSNAVFQVK
jgi:uncharacterized repeat protein (TIGR03803 family)